MFKEVETLEEKLLLLDAASTAGGWVGKLLKLRDESQEAADKAEWDREVDQAIEEVLREEWPKWWKKHPRITRISRIDSE